MQTNNKNESDFYSSFLIFYYDRMVEKAQFRKGSYAGINDFVDMIRYLQVSQDLDVLIGVSGFKGFGKSTFSLQVMIRYVKKFMGVKNFTPSMLEKYTAYTIKDLNRLLNNLPVYAPIAMDEAVNFAMGEDWMLGSNKRTKKKFAKIRNKHHVFFFNIPDLWWLDKKYRENMMTLWVHVVKKGHVMVSTPKISPGIQDRWDRKWLQKQFAKKPTNYFTPLATIMKVLRRYPPYFDEFAFPKLDKDIYEKHLELRNSRTMEDGSDEKQDEIDKMLRTTWKAQPMLIKKKWTAFQKWYTGIMANGGKPTTNDIYSFFFEDFKTGEKLIRSPRTLDKWMERLELTGDQNPNIWK